MLAVPGVNPCEDGRRELTPQLSSAFHECDPSPPPPPPNPTPLIDDHDGGGDDDGSNNVF